MTISHSDNFLNYIYSNVCYPKKIGIHVQNKLNYSRKYQGTALLKRIQYIVHTLEYQNIRKVPQYITIVHWYRLRSYTFILYSIIQNAEKFQIKNWIVKNYTYGIVKALLINSVLHKTCVQNLAKLINLSNLQFFAYTVQAKQN